MSCRGCAVVTQQPAWGPAPQPSNVQAPRPGPNTLPLQLREDVGKLARGEERPCPFDRLWKELYQRISCNSDWAQGMVRDGSTDTQ